MKLLRTTFSLGAALLALVLCSQSARADAITNVAEVTLDGYQLVYDLAIPNTANFRNANSVPYTTDNSATTGYFDRVAYYMELDTGSGSQYVYASMDAFTGDPTKIGLPHNVDNPIKWQQTVSNLNVDSNKAGIVTGTSIATGNIELWSTNYNQSNAIGIPGASGSAFDFGDGNAGIGTGYGSFQVHNHGAGQTLLAYNRFGTTGNSDLGIGSQTTGSPDWTFAQNAASYTIKNLEVLVRPAAVPDAPAAVVSNATVIANDPDAADYKLVYELNVPDSAVYNNTNNVPYTIDAHAGIADGSFSRVAYYLELDGPNGPQYAWVSMDAFTDDAGLIGVPSDDTGAFFQQIVDNMNVVSNVPGVVNGNGIATGNIEFWDTNYGQTGTLGLGGNNGLYDFDDDPVDGGGYGSFQIHNYGAGQTIMAYNRWGSTGGISDLGIGNQPSGNPDWTFSQNANQYTLKNVYVLVLQPSATPEPSALILATLGLMSLGMVRRRRRR